LIERLRLLRHVGQFDSVDAGGQLPFTKLTLVYAENARGKTTLAAILRSLGNSDPSLIAERQRLGSPHAPHVVIWLNAPPPSSPLVFQNGDWSADLSQLAVFDDQFVAENVCSGLAIETEHRQKLHELILGAQGVTLNAAVQAHVARVEEHNRELRTRAEAIPATARGTLSMDAFCALGPVDNIEAAIQEAERAIAAARSAEAVRQEPDFSPVALPAFDTAAVNELLLRRLPDLEAEAAARVQAHLAKLGDGGESWVGDGMPRIAGVSAEQERELCPFCAQDLGGSPLIEHYRAYFSDAYAGLKKAVANQITAIERTHAGEMPAAFERAIRVATQRREFWRTFMQVPEVSIDTAAVGRSWNAAGTAVLECLRAKQAMPLDPTALPNAALTAIAVYDQSRRQVSEISESLRALNQQIALVKEQAAAANIAALSADLAKLKAVQARFDLAIGAKFEAYLSEKAAKAATEALRDQSRAALDRYRQNVFPTYETAINEYLRRFYAGFRLGSVTSVNTRGGSACSYNVVINNVPVAVTGATGGGPSFRNTLSAGDRNTLALAFFFASLDQDPQLAQKIVIIDDPITSLDEHRSLTTIQEIRRLLTRVDQIIVMSHSKPFLCEIWEGADSTMRSAIKITRDGDGSSLAAWDVRQDSISEHDKRHEKVAAYMRSSHGVNEREIAAALRPILEHFMRVAYPEAFPPGSLLGPFISVCRWRVGMPSQILNAYDIGELRDLLDYANKFHHDTNAAWETEAINDQQLLKFCQRTLAFSRRP
jgi:wobble nucleotide-excising tRNase